MILAMFRTKRKIREVIRARALLRGLISAVEKTRRKRRKKAEPATHAGTISIMVLPKNMKLFAVVGCAKRERAVLIADIVIGVRIL